MKARIYSVLLTGDQKKAFLQICIKQEDRDSLRFHWRLPNSSDILVYRFTRALFGMTCSPFLLNRVIKQHVDSWESRYPELMEEIRDGLYVNDLITGGETVEITARKKAAATEVFDNATFTLRKWHSNVQELESPSTTSQEELTYAKEQLGGTSPSEGKLLGFPWNKEEDTISVVLKGDQTETTKRGVLSYLARIYDPLGLASPRP